MPLFIAVNGLAELEDQEKWEDARVLLYEMWNADRGNPDLLLRLLSECWHVLVDWYCCIKNEGLSYEAFKDTLIECTTYGLTHFGRDPRFLLLAGYMISMFPYLFYDDPDPRGVLDLEWESKGKDMLAMAYRQNPDNLMAKVMHLGARPNSAANEKKEYREAKRELTPLLDEYFTDNTEIERYFKEGLTDPITGGCNVTIPLRRSYEGQSTRGRCYGTGDTVVILSNMDTNNREEWMPFVQSLPLEHCRVLLYDYLQQEDDQSRVLEDVIFYAKRGNTEKIVLVGASRGGVASVKVAARSVPDKAVVGVVAISAPLEHEGVVFFDRGELDRIGIPKLLVGTEDDECAAGVRQMYELIAEPKELCFYPGGAHGTEIFDTVYRNALLEKLNAFVGVP